MTFLRKSPEDDFTIEVVTIDAEEVSWQTFSSGARIVVARQGRTSEIPQAYLYDTPTIARTENAADGQKAPPDVRRS